MNRFASYLVLLPLIALSIYFLEHSVCREEKCLPKNAYADECVLLTSSTSLLFDPKSNAIIPSWYFGIRDLFHSPEYVVVRTKERKVLAIIDPEEIGSRLKARIDAPDSCRAESQ